MVLLYLTRLHVSTEFLCWLGSFSVFLPLCSYTLASYYFPLGVIFRFLATLLLRACFLLLSSWCNLPVFRHFAPIHLLPTNLLLEQPSGFLPLCSYSLDSSLFPLGVIFRFFDTLLLRACFPFVSTWSNLPVSCHFAPTRLIPLYFLLE